MNAVLTPGRGIAGISAKYFLSPPPPKLHVPALSAVSSYEFYRHVNKSLTAGYNPSGDLKGGGGGVGGVRPPFRGQIIRNIKGNDRP